MLNPGTYDLGTLSISGALAATVSTQGVDDGGNTAAYIGQLQGALRATLQIRFISGGAGGTKVRGFVQTTFDQGNTWVDVACFAFATNANAVKVANVSALTPRTTPLVNPTDGGLGDDTVLDGLVGDRWRMKVDATGAWPQGTQISGRLTVG